jgi:hypothetical protein
LLLPVLTGLWPECCNISTLDPVDSSVYGTRNDSAAHDRGGPSDSIPFYFFRLYISPSSGLVSSPLQCEPASQGKELLSVSCYYQLYQYVGKMNDAAILRMVICSHRRSRTSSHRHFVGTAAWRNGEGGVERAHGVIIETQSVYECHAGAWAENSWKLQIPNARCRSGQYCCHNTTCLL